ncbi:acyl-CoA dehydrogenase family protein [Streptomyces sp. NPDC098101]|uniref:acyl-CoA dehydrogenase family protein n=1 Tax=Streptomyces sp. NPDC098101 TaxID=3366096 RepID=UPI00380919D1
MRHFVLPRADYEILPDSCRVVGLAGTGSKDTVVEDASVPDHRALNAHEVSEGILTERNRPGNPLYTMPFGVMFSSAISAVTLGIAEGALAAFLAYTRQRITIVGSRAAEDPHQLTGPGEAAADLDASRTHLLATTDRMYEDVLTGRAIGIEARTEARRNQVRASRRATDVVDALFRRAGGGSLRLDQPLQRHWRDVHAAMNHLCNVADSVYEGWSRDQFGLPVGIRVLVCPLHRTLLPRPTAPVAAGVPARPRPRPWPGSLSLPGQHGHRKPHRSTAASGHGTKQCQPV